MKRRREQRARGPRLALESVIILGLSLKLILSAAFLVFWHDSAGLPLQPAPAYAQEQPPAGGEAPAEGLGPPSPGQAETQPQVDENLTRQYQSMIDTLKLKEEELGRREDRIKEREKALDLLEKELQGRLAELEAKRVELDALVEQQAKLVEQQKILKNARIEHLVTAFKGMRPEKAGALVDSLEDDVAVDILSAMPGRSVGQILAFVTPEKAARLTKAIRERQPPEEPMATPVAPAGAGTPGQ
ncbi:MAG: hypothetical protein AB1896_08785 [Thermodesulfobacteriota bacterium]